MAVISGWQYLDWVLATCLWDRDRIAEKRSVRGNWGFVKICGVIIMNL